MLPDEDAESTDAAEVQDDELDDGTTDAELDAAEAEGAEDERDEDSGEDHDERGHEGDGQRPDKVAGRAKNDFGRLREERREARERADRLERELAEVRRAQLGRGAEEARRAEDERLALMSTEEKLAYYRQQDQRVADQRFSTLQFQLQDERDADRFERLCDRNPAIAAVAEEVDRVLAAERAAGRAGASREIIAKYVIGDRALKNAGRTKGKAVKRAEASKKRETASAGATRSQQTKSDSRGGSEAEQRRKRLEGITF